MEIYSKNGTLYHHGVKGMKWGVRKDKKISSRVGKAALGFAKKTPAGTAIKTTTRIAKSSVNTAAKVVKKSPAGTAARMLKRHGKKTIKQLKKSPQFSLGLAVFSPAYLAASIVSSRVKKTAKAVSKAAKTTTKTDDEQKNDS